MSDSGEEDQRNYSGHIMKKEQWAYIKIECLRGNTMPIIIPNLREACSHDAVNCSPVVRWFKQLQYGRSVEDNLRLVVPLPLLITLQLRLCPHYLTNNDDAGDGRDVRYTENNDTPHFNRISDEKKGCGILGTTHAAFHTKKCMELIRNIDSLWKGRNWVFATNNHYRWNLGAWLQIQIEISDRGVKGKILTKVAKIPIPSFKGETNACNGLQLYWCNHHIHGAIYGCTVDQHVCVHFLHKIFRL